MGHVTCVGNTRDAHRMFLGKGDHLENLCVSGMIILNRAFRSGMGTGCIWLSVSSSSERPVVNKE